MSNYTFTFENIRKSFEMAVSQGYTVVTCAQFSGIKKTGLPAKTLVNRVDIDVDYKKAAVLGAIFSELGIPATFFLRLHAREYNAFSFDCYRIIKELIRQNHEIGLHTEVMDQSAIWNEPPEACLQKDIDVFNRIFDINIRGVASHGSLTGINNLDFWNTRKPADFGLLYEAYDNEPEFGLFRNSLYISDSEWNRWKCYRNGVLVPGDQRSLEEHLKDQPPLIYALIHSDTYYNIHFYE